MMMMMMWNYNVMTVNDVMISHLCDELLLLRNLKLAVKQIREARAMYLKN